jgi:hypothetical protein
MNFCNCIGFDPGQGHATDRETRRGEAFGAKLTQVADK